MPLLRRSRSKNATTPGRGNGRGATRGSVGTACRALDPHRGRRLDPHRGRRLDPHRDRRLDPHRAAAPAAARGAYT
jgi:hypothetical protein